MERLCVPGAKTLSFAAALRISSAVGIEKLFCGSSPPFPDGLLWRLVKTTLKPSLLFLGASESLEVSNDIAGICRETWADNLLSPLPRG